MNLSLNFENISDDELKILTDRYVNIRIHFAERLNLIKQGETNMKKKLLLIVEDTIKTRENYDVRPFTLLNNLIDDLKELINE